MLKRLKYFKIVQSFLTLKGNARISFLFERLWGIPFVFYNFYLSLYLKELGITEKQFGVLIAAGFIAGAVFSVFAGIITDMLGRKKTTLIFDFFSWPVSIFIYFISGSFVPLVIAAVVNSFVRIVSVSWNLMVVEDADSRQRVAAYNLINIITIAVGVITPLSGILVAASGVVFAEKCFMIFAIVSMTIMIIVRNHFYTETRMGKEILDEHKGMRFRDIAGKGLYRGAFKVFRRNPGSALIAAIFVLVNLTLPLGAFGSMYFAPYMTEFAGIDKASVSVLGGVYPAVTLFIFLVVIPRITKKGEVRSVFIGFVIQVISLLLITLIQGGGLIPAVLCVALYGFGFGLAKPYIDSLLADVSGGKERAGFYSLVSTTVSIFSALIGYVSGYIYTYDPRLIFYITAGILALCAVAIACYGSIIKKRPPVQIDDQYEEPA